MLTSPHAAAGAAIGALMPNPLIAIPVAIASHYILDMVPHWQETLAPYNPNFKTYIRIPIDLFLAIGIVSAIAFWNPLSASTIWIAAIAANVPDLDALFVLKRRLLEKGVLKKYWDWHCKIQNETSKFYGVVPQVFVIIVALVVGYGAGV